MNLETKHIVIVGGGTAGWLTAGILGAHFDLSAGYSITLVESPNVKTIGVGEGTWPSMASTLRRMGIPEAQFVSECDASFKQGSYFQNWITGDGDSYYHPFSLPMGYTDVNLVDHWLENNLGKTFDEFSTPQTDVCEQQRAPKQSNTPDYASVLNYGYHLNAGKFANLLMRHCTQHLGVQHILDDITNVVSEDGLIQSVHSSNHGAISGDLFIDCTGFKSLLLGEHLGVPFVSRKDVLFNDRAMAFQVPYKDETSPINSCTHATAHSNGWIWDIGLPTRRGIGIVYSSKYGDEAAAFSTIENYLAEQMPHINIADLTPNKITLNPGHRETFWKGNCLAIGLSSGFIDPLEATAMVLIEQSARFLTENLPVNKAEMYQLAEKYNKRLETHWSTIIDFIKLHYVLSKRDDSPYWLDHRREETMPESLKRSLAIWKLRAPWHTDNTLAEELFPPASYQYILYGMGFDSISALPGRRMAGQERQHLAELTKHQQNQKEKLLQHLPTNRQLLHDIYQRWNARQG